MKADQFTREERMVEVGDGHRLYAQVWGAEDPVETIVFLHGGPGSGCNDKHKTLFDPLRQRVVFLDQRGAGKSTPKGSLKANDTDHLIEDINAVTAAFKVEKFAITGGSWGSCLALAYAIRYPERVSRMVLRGIFTGQQKETDFLEQGEFRDFYPDVWAEFVSSVPVHYRENPAAYHVPRILGSDPETVKQSAYAYAKLEGGVISLDDRNFPDDYDTFDPSNTIIECHYMTNACFLPEGYILENVSRLKMPIHLIQGRFDAVCPPVTAYELSKLLPDGRLYWTVAGHSGNDRANWELTKALLAS